jgi:EEF1A lysine methyltransferase 4
MNAGSENINKAIARTTTVKELDPCSEKTNNSDPLVMEEQADVAAPLSLRPSIESIPSLSQLPRLNSAYESKDYWEERFANEHDFEWLVSYEELADQLQPCIQPESRVLVVGCGNSPLSADLYDAGYRNIVNIDYSTTVIRAMKDRHAVSRPQMEWVVMDMTDLSEFSSSSFDVVIDKAAMDALLAKEGDVWNPDERSIDAARSMCHHISRILRRDGHFIHISLAQPHFRKKYLLGRHNGNSSGNQSDDNYSDEFGWYLNYEAVGRDSQAGCFGHYLYVMTKKAV